jgi:hypothetical protein
MYSSVRPVPSGALCATLRPSATTAAHAGPSMATLLKAPRTERASTATRRTSWSVGAIPMKWRRLA